MATNKNQHFVPRCYLKPFSINGEGLALNLYNIDRRKFIQNAPLKHQCSKDYFYGKDDRLERALQFTEGSYGAVVRKILTPGYKFSNEDKAFLKLFWFLQYLRTEAASRRSVEMFEGIVSGIGGRAQDDFKINIKEAVVHSMNIFSNNMHVVRDLKACLVKNNSGVGFITSDDPAILTNRWYKFDRRARGVGFGVGSSGVLAFLPLSEKIMFVAYDGDVYSIPNRNGWVVCKNKLDATAFNQFQYFNCRANIFFRDAESICEVDKNFSEFISYRPESRHILNAAILDGNEDDYERYVVVDPSEARACASGLIHIQQFFPAPPRWPSQIRWRSKGAVYTNGTGVGYLRVSRVMDMESRGEFWKEPAIKKKKF